MHVTLSLRWLLAASWSYYRDVAEKNSRTALLCAGLLVATLFASRYCPDAVGSEFPADTSRRDVPSLLRATESVRELDESALIELVPQQSGLHYVGCPNCNGGRQENQLTWSIERPDEVACRYCKHRYPSDKYPMRDSVEVHSPTGQLVRFPYWADDKGYRYFFQAKRDDEVREYLADRARDLALLYAVTKDKAHARRAALILDQFAQVFPGWCFHYDYPFQQKQIYDGKVSPDKFRSGFRTARWTWWAYMDVPQTLVQAYDWIRDSGALDELSKERGVDVAARIERDLFHNACEQVLANPETLGNMSPTAWRTMVHAGRVLHEPRYVHETVRRIGAFVDKQFFYDGMWSEGSPDYASQSVNGLQQVLRLLDGYSDPPGYVDPVDGSRFDKLDLSAAFPSLLRARDALAKMRLPNGRAVPVHDTWPTSRRGSVPQTMPFLLPALGHACLGGGEGADQLQLHLTWSGGYGHSHGDNLSLLLFAHGRESLSDLGYTHTAYRAWTLATVAHNTVVIDGLNQQLGSQRAQTDGRLLGYDVSDARVQYVSADGSRGYPDVAKMYRRTVVLVDAGEGRKYVVDLFEVEGGRTHDYFLHGDADVRGTLSTSLPLTPLASLLPSGFEWTPTRNEGETGRIRQPHYAYGFLNQLQSAALPANQTTSVVFQTEASRAGVRVSLLSEPDSQLIVGQNPSIRAAKEDDSQLDKVQRPFLAVRHEANSGTSRYVSVVEPYATEPFIASIEQVAAPAGTTALAVQFGDRTDLICLGAAKPVEFQTSNATATFSGSLGLLTLREGAVEYATALGEGGWKCGQFELPSVATCEKPLRGVDEDNIIVDASSDPNIPKAGTVIRVVTADGWVYPFTISSATVVGEHVKLRVVEAAALSYDASSKRLALTAFPQREHSGAVSVQWSPRSTR